jgi:PhnB protein
MIDVKILQMIGRFYMKKIIPHIMVDNCQEALEYYKEILGGEVQKAQKADGIEMFKGHEGKLIHAELHINEDCVIYFVDIFERNFNIGNNIGILLELESDEEISRIFTDLSKEGTVKMELQDTFWGAKHGELVDKNGIKWELNYTK